MVVSNSNIVITIEAVKYSYNAFETEYYQIQNVFEEQGFTVKNFKIEAYNGKEAITCELSKDGKSAVYYVIASDSNDYVFAGLVANRSGVIDYSIMNTLVSILNNSTYVGDYSNYSENFSANFDLNN